jgi:hypothetical protein
MLAGKADGSRGHEEVIVIIVSSDVFWPNDTEPHHDSFGTGSGALRSRKNTAFSTLVVSILQRRIVQ